MNNADPQARAAEIENLVASNELNQATKRLMDLVTDFSNSKIYRRDVINIRASYTDLNDEQRRLGKTDAIKIDMRKLREQILEFAEVILNEYKLTKEEITSPEDTDYSQPKPFTDPINIYLPQKVDKIDETKTQYELDRDKFITKRKLINNSTSSRVFECYGIFKSYKSRAVKFQLCNIDINLKLGEITAVVGENGNGKTTLLKIIAGELPTNAGKIIYPCLNLNSKPDLYYIKQQIAYIPQELPKWYGLLADNLHFAASIHGITGQDNQDIVDFTISRLGLEQYKKASWNEISGGFKMRFVLAKAIICNPKLIILDEPLANLDINTQVLFLKDLRDFARSKKNPISIIISSQHLYEVENIADNILFIKNGQAKYNGSVKNFGEDRENNSYEIDCNLSKEQIMDLLEPVNYKTVEQACNSFIIHTSLDVTSNDLIRVFLEHNISLKYFRDISKSTRKLFETQL
ncbi:MAG: ABC transporter ATP-binding protein [Nostoc sp.]|uniref:ABC transporter ATP-binding protein n=1 Tax=Nostoc sp. TaxID=1180 RepID=UPI002FFA5EEB